MEVALGLYDVVKSEKLSTRLNEWAELLLDAHLKEVAVLKESRYKVVSKTEFIVDAKYYLQVYLKFFFHMLLRKYCLPDLILQQELMRDLWPLVWEVTVHISKGQLEEAAKILPQIKPPGSTEASVAQRALLHGRSQLNSSELRGDNLEDLYLMSRLVLKENLQPGRLPMTSDFAAHFCSCVVYQLAPRVVELIEYKFAHY
eukprot:g12556.t1